MDICIFSAFANTESATVDRFVYTSLCSFAGVSLERFLEVDYQDKGQTYK